MTNDEHQRERMRHWSASFLASTALCAPHQNADMALAEFDKRFPAPALPVPDQSAMGRAVSETILAQTDELATLRAKARLWDAVRSGKVDLVRSADGDGFYANDKFRATAAEAVQAAIDAGALK